MVFRNQYINLDFFKRIRALKGKPLWIDDIPKETARKDTYLIAAKYQGNFSRAFLQAVREFLPNRMPMGFKAAYRNRSVKNVEDAIFGEDFGGERFTNKIENAYFDVVDASGKVTTKELNKDFDTNLGFEAEVKKAEVAVPIVPINDYSAKWIRERSLTLVKDLNEQQRKVIQTMLADGFEKGLRAEEVYAEIKANIGLTGRESQAVLNRRALLEEQGIPEERIEYQVDKYREQLLRKRAERIARTETIAADAAGRQHAWQLAQDSGQLPKVERVWISSPPSPNPNRPCEICLELDGTTAPIGGFYESSLVGPVSGPGPEAHPSCVVGDTEVVASGIEAASKRWYNGDLVILRTASNNRLVCTPNHPILTPGGWVAANTLNVGSSVISYIGVENKSPSFFNDNHEYMPTVVDKISNLVDELNFSSSIPMPVAPEDFHGDGTGSNVAIIKSNSLLRNTINSSSSKFFNKFKFFWSSCCKLFLHCLGSFYFFFNRRNTPPRRGVGSDSLSFSLLRGILRMFKLFSFALSSDVNSVFRENSPDNRAASSPLFGSRILTEFGDRVIVDNITSVDVQFASTHVYNLQTVDGYYIAQNIFSHNCRCSESLVRT